MLGKDKAMVGKPSYERKEKEFYETPEWCTEVLLDYIKFKDDVWEPACGNFAISRVLKWNGYGVWSSDIKKYYEKEPDEILDFFESNRNVSDDIITNPPYNIAKEFVDKALSLTEKYKGKVAMLLRNEWDCAKSRTYLFTEKPFRCKIVLTKRPRWIKGTTTSPRHNYAWFVWDWQYQGKPYLEYQK